MASRQSRTRPSKRMQLCEILDNSYIARCRSLLDMYLGGLQCLQCLTNLNPCSINIAILDTTLEVLLPELPEITFDPDANEPPGATAYHAINRYYRGLHEIQLQAQTGTLDIPGFEGRPYLQAMRELTSHYQVLRDNLLSARVLESHPPIPKYSQFELLDWYKMNNPKMFRRLVRVSPQVFDILVQMIEDDTVFHNNSYNQQMPVARQLAIFLHRLGHYGNGCTLESAGDWAGVSVGTVMNCTRRCAVAVLNLHDYAVQWPSEEEKEAAKEYVEEKTNVAAWRNGYLAVDGTPVPLFQRPGYYGDNWWGKDKVYAMAVQCVVLVHNLLIVDYVTGHTGSTHDARAFRDTLVYRKHDQLLRPGEFIWADSAYPAAPWLVTPFKKPANGQLSSQQRHFNYHLSSVRVRVEHVYGMLKGRFASLRELRIQISDRTMAEWAVVWIRCCIILHNLVIRIEAAETLHNEADDVQLRNEGRNDRYCNDDGEADGSVTFDEMFAEEIDEMPGVFDGIPAGVDVRQWLMTQLEMVHPSR